MSLWWHGVQAFLTHAQLAHKASRLELGLIWAQLRWSHARDGFLEIWVISDDRIHICIIFCLWANLRNELGYQGWRNLAGAHVVCNKGQNFNIGFCILFDHQVYLCITQLLCFSIWLYLRYPCTTLRHCARVYVAWWIVAYLHVFTSLLQEHVHRHALVSCQFQLFFFFEFWAKLSSIPFIILDPNYMLGKIPCNVQPDVLDLPNWLLI